MYPGLALEGRVGRFGRPDDVSFRVRRAGPSLALKSPLPFLETRGIATTEV
jgi:hypothetical protein